ncbi:CcmD family protein [Pedobacter montanisoli]|uniref:CcmD family protein n=1 Tax=Pedobacter montanisoli TaxID=2923277 RepID=A0ABS9ZW76_9SPHI|nr:CcmD family protein [Pedobacter montanisoli]MCJ0742565.1 CcmD family protein [Pedobacter montanisoli]
MKRILSILAFLTLFVQNIFAQNNEIEMADHLRAEGKIYVVVICIVIILLGLLAYLFSLDKKVKMLEKNSGPKN